MKFVCERDTLAEAVATAQRAVASRTGALPVLSGLQVTLRPATTSSSSAPTSSSRSGCRSPAEVDGEGSAVVPAQLVRRRSCASSTAGTVTVESATTTP